MLKSLQRNKPNLIPNFERQLGFRRKAVAVIFWGYIPFLTGKVSSMDDKFKTLEKYNLWGGNDFPTGYKRQDYLDRILSYIL